MAKFKLRFKVEKLELEVEADRPDAAPMITQAVHQQLTGLLKPAEVMVNDPSRQSSLIVEPQLDDHTNGGRRRTKPTAKTGDSNAKAKPLDFTHDVSKWGTPKQSFTAPEKAIWLLYVIEQQTGTKALGAQTIVQTFNKHFRQAGLLNPRNINRDLAKPKQAARPQVGEDTTKTPPEWFLTDEGKTLAVKLVAKAIGSTEASV